LGSFLALGAVGGIAWPALVAMVALTAATISATDGSAARSAAGSVAYESAEMPDVTTVDRAGGYNRDPKPEALSQPPGDVAGNLSRQRRWVARHNRDE